MYVQWGLTPNIQNINIKVTSYAMGLRPINVRSKFEILHSSYLVFNNLKKYPNQILRTRSQHNDEFPTMWFAILKIEVPL